MKLFCVFIIILLSFFPRKGRAEESTFTVEDLVRFALTNSPTLGAARFAIEEARGRLKDSGRLSNPEVEASFGPHIRGRERSFTIGFNQRLPVTARLRLEKSISRIEVAFATAEVAEFSRRLAFQVRTTAVTLATIDAQQRLNRQQQTNSVEWQEAIRQAVTVGEGSELDLVQLELEAQRLLGRDAQLEAVRSQVVSELILLTGSNRIKGFHVAELQGELKRERAPLIELRPDIVAAQHRAEAARAALRLMRANRWQDIEVGVFGEIDRSEDAPNGIETDHIAGVRLGIPLPLWNRATGRIAEATAKSQRAEAEAAVLLARAGAEVAVAAKQLDVAREHRVLISTGLLPKARTVEDRLVAVHKQGQVPFSDVLRARERRLELEYSELEAQREVHLAWARYLEALGIVAEEQ